MSCNTVGFSSYFYGISRQNGYLSPYVGYLGYFPYNSSILGASSSTFNLNSNNKTENNTYNNTIYYDLHNTINYNVNMTLTYNAAGEVEPGDGNNTGNPGQGNNGQGDNPPGGGVGRNIDVKV